MENKKRDITTEGAKRLLEAMCKSSAEAFSAAVVDYVRAADEERKLKAVIIRNMKALDRAQAAKMNAEHIIRQEYGFMTGKETVKPPIDGANVSLMLIRGALEDMGGAEEFLTEFMETENDKICRLYNSGLTIKKISEEVGMSRDRVDRVLKKEGLKK